MDVDWIVVQAAACGTSHLERHIPCQDAFASWQGSGWVVAAVADGAGSASHSELGARSCVDYVVRALGERVAEAVESAVGPTHLTDAVEGVVEMARSDLADKATREGVPIDQLACTLVIVVANEAEGFIAHIGDGTAVATPEGEPPVVSPPENGEYSNETWFVTDERWKNHLRITPFGRVNHIALMSDGTMSFAMTRDRTALFGPFIDPVLAYLRRCEAGQRDEALASLLASERTHAITGDDKTLVLIMAANGT